MAIRSIVALVLTMVSCIEFYAVMVYKNIEMCVCSIVVIFRRMIYHACMCAIIG